MQCRASYSTMDESSSAMRASRSEFVTSAAAREENPSVQNESSSERSGEWRVHCSSGCSIGLRTSIAPVFAISAGEEEMELSCVDRFEVAVGRLGHDARKRRQRALIPGRAGIRRSNCKLINLDEQKSSSVDEKITTSFVEEVGGPFAQCPRESRSGTRSGASSRWITSFAMITWKEPRRPRWPPQLHGEAQMLYQPRNRGQDLAGRTADCKVGAGTAAATKVCSSGHFRLLVVQVFFGRGSTPSRDYPKY